MIDKEELRKFIKKIIREEVIIIVEHFPETSYDHAKIQVGLWMKDENFRNDEFSFSETRIYN